MRVITEKSLRHVMKMHDMNDSKTSLIFSHLFNECKELNAWQPIETAPLGKKLWLFMNGSLGIGRTECKLYNDSDRQYFTHWQELPEDPK